MKRQRTQRAQNMYECKAKDSRKPCVKMSQNLDKVTERKENTERRNRNEQTKQQLTIISNIQTTHRKQTDKVITIRSQHKSARV